MEAGQIIPVNLQVGDFQTEAIPLKLMDHFIEKAGSLVIVKCPCRLTNGYKDHNIDLG